jgi:hypothetical protein
MKVRAYWNSRTKDWSLWSFADRRTVAHASRVLLRDVTFDAKGNITGQLEACDRDDGCECGKLVRYYEWHLCPRANNAYGKAAAKYGKPVHSEGEAFNVGTAPMVFLGHTKGRKPLPGILAFDPCDMTEAESAAATE